MLSGTALMLLAAMPCAASAQVRSSTFERDAEQWGTYSDATGFGWVAIGNPHGSIEGTDGGAGGRWGFESPGSWAGDLTCSLGFTLRWELWTSDTTVDDEPLVPDVQLHGGGVTLALDLPQPSAQVWNEVVVDLAPGAGWRLGDLGGPAATASAFEAVLSGFESLRIRAEYSRLVGDFARLDNVAIEGPPSADCDGSGELDFFDFLCFQNLFAAGDPQADCDGSGGLDFFDFLCFQDSFASGCR